MKTYSRELPTYLDSTKTQQFKLVGLTIDFLLKKYGCNSVVLKMIDDFEIMFGRPYDFKLDYKNLNLNAYMHGWKQRVEYEVEKEIEDENYALRERVMCRVLAER